jgi:ribosomal protein S18 acetylase RimI-like enzyme
VRALAPRDHEAAAELAGLLYADLGDYGPAVRAWLRDPRVKGWVVDGAAGLDAFVLVAHADDARPPYLYLLAIGVTPPARRHGLGRALVARVLEDASTASYAPDRIELAVADRNDAARALFRDAGFEERGEATGRYASGARPVRMVRPVPPRGGGPPFGGVRAPAGGD